MEAEASIADVPLHVGDSLLPTKTLLMNVLALVLVVVLARFYVLKPRRLPPGPTGWPLLGCLPYLKTKPLRYLSALGEQYGSVFSIYMGGRLAVILNDYEAVREAFEENGDAFGGRTPFYLLQVGKQDSRGEVHGIVDTEGPHWKEQKLFAMATLKQLGVGKAATEALIHAEMTSAVDHVTARRGAAFDPAVVVGGVVTNVVVHLVFGRRHDYDDDELVTIMGNVRQGIQLISSLSVVNHVPLTRYVPRFAASIHRLVQCRRSAYRYIEKYISEQKRALEHDTSTNLCSAYLRKIASEEKAGNRTSNFTHEELKMLIHNLLVAGTETSATRLNWGLIYLSLNPQVQINVQQELDEVVGRGRQPGINDRKNLPYTEATVLEILRCGNTSALGLPHATTRAVNFRGFDIPARTMIIPHMAHLMNDPKKFTDPEKFQPSRFLDEQGKFIGSPFVIPYSVGPRVCLGKTLANMEIYLVVSCILQSFTLKMAEEEPTPELNPDTVMRHPPPCKLIFDPR